MKLIVAVDKNWGIGKDGELLFSVPEDMKFFRATTIGKVIVVGRKTLESFPGGRPLKDRVNVVLSKNYEGDGVTVCRSIDELMRVLGHFSSDDVYICGGGSVYRALYKYCDEALVTKIDAFKAADAFFPNLDADPDWQLDGIASEIDSGGVNVKFCRYVNLGKKV